MTLELEKLKSADWISDTGRRRLLAIEEKVSSRTLDIIVIGQFKRGKSSFINALVEKEILPAGVLPLTSAVTIVEHGQENAEILLNDGRKIEASLEEISDYITEEKNPENIKDVKRVVARSHLSSLPPNTRVIDTPGIDSTNEHNSSTTFEYLPKADIALLILSAEQPLGASELMFLKQSRSYFSKLMIVVNKVDLVTQAELAKIEAHVQQVLEKAFTHSNFQIWPVSAKTHEGMKALRTFLEQMTLNDGEALSITSAKIKIARVIEDETRLLRMRLDFLQQDEASRADKRQKLEILLEDVEREVERIQFALQAEFEQLRKVLNEHSSDAEEKSLHEGQSILLGRINAIQSINTQDFKSKIRESTSDVGRSSTELYTAALFRIGRDLYSKFHATNEARFDELASRIRQQTTKLFSVEYQIDRETYAFEPRSGFYLNPDLLIPISKGLLIGLASYAPKFLSEKMLISHARRVFEIALRSSVESIRWDLVQALDLNFRRYRVNLIENLKRIRTDLADVVLEDSKHSFGANDAEITRLIEFIHSAQSFTDQFQI